jgi:acyl-coenzyme A synthetase/AMP-(fatty) acid ligase/acyl carrier protein
MQKKYVLTEKDVLLQKTPLVFDVSVWELFWWSFTGASVCLLPPEGEKDPRKIIDEIEKNGVTTIHFVPSMLSAFLDVAEVGQGDQLQSLRQVFASGEALSANRVNRISKILYAAYGTRLINLYGPTEATVDVSYYECDCSKKNEVIPIGKPIDNTRLYILDKNSGLAALGVAGELCIGGAGLARGYLNNAALTSEKFITAFFDREERLYRTGDLACWLPDGNIKYLGRMDHQVKIRGYRIEPGEIEVRLLSYANVKQAVVTCLETNDDKKLVAFLVSETNAVLNTLDVRQFLKNELPEYMIPALIRKIDEIPLTNSGKIDIKGMLASIDKSLLEKSSLIKPRTDIEISVAKIWSDFLTIDEIGVDENFFDLGGHSILLLRVNSAINDEYGIELPLNLYFSNTLGQICKEIETKLKDLQPGKIESEIEYLK